MCMQNNHTMYKMLWSLFEEKKKTFVHSTFYDSEFKESNNLDSLVLSA